MLLLVLWMWPLSWPFYSPSYMPARQTRSHAATRRTKDASLKHIENIRAVVKLVYIALDLRRLLMRFSSAQKTFPLHFAVVFQLEFSQLDVHAKGNSMRTICIDTSRLS